MTICARVHIIHLRVDVWFILLTFCASNARTLASIRTGGLEGASCAS